MEYYIYVTNKCNLNCSYCSVMLEHNRTQLPDEPIYSLDALKEFVDSIQSTRPNDTARIYFFGGEPTLNFDTILSIILTFKDIKTYNIEFILHTNGLLLSYIPKHILEYIDVVFLSINYEKIYEKGKISDYFIKLIQDMAKIKQYKTIPFIGRLTVSEGASIYSECTLIGDFFDCVYWQLDNQKELKDIILYKEQYKKEIELLFMYWLEFLKKGIILRYVPFLSIVQHLIHKYPTPKQFYCGYGDDMIYIQTDGSCYACCDEVDLKRHFIGDIYNGITYKNMEIKDTICKECNDLIICGGRCGRMHKDFERERIQQYCEMNKFTFDLVRTGLPEIKELINSFSHYKEIFSTSLMDYTELLP